MILFIISEIFTHSSQHFLKSFSYYRSNVFVTFSWY